MVPIMPLGQAREGPRGGGRGLLEKGNLTKVSGGLN